MFTLLKWRKLDVQVVSIFTEPSSRWIMIPTWITQYFDLDSACSLVKWSISWLVPYSSPKTVASWRRDLHRRHMVLSLNGPVLQSCCAGGRWCFDQQVLVQRNSKNRTLLYPGPCYVIVLGIFFLILLVRRAKLLAHDWSSGCLAIAYAIEKSLLKSFGIEELKDESENENTKKSTEY